MSIQINGEQEHLIGQAIQAGLIGTAEEAVEMGVGNVRRYFAQHRPASFSPAENLADLFAASPFAGTNLNFRRDTDQGREVAL